jgi:hypothetical protein
MSDEINLLASGWLSHTHLHPNTPRRRCDPDNVRNARGRPGRVRNKLTKQATTETTLQLDKRIGAWAMWELTVCAY